MSVSEESKGDSTNVLGVEILTAEKNEEHTTHSKVIFIFIHGAFTENDRYKPFLQSLQQACLKKGIEADIGYGTYTNHIPNLARTLEILSELNKSSNYDAKFVFGHSMGALVAIAAAYPSLYDGLIQIGCNFQSWFPGFSEPETVSLASYPKPVLTVLGEVDGFLKYFSVHQDLQDLDREIKKRGRDNLDLEKPIIILKDVNHMQVADNIVGEMISKTNRHDYESRLSLEEAHAKIAEVIASFVVITTLRPSKSLQNRDGDEFKVFAQACKDQFEQTQLSREMMERFQALSDDAFIASHAMDMQRSVANLKEKLEIVPNFHLTKHDFLYSKPVQLNSFPSSGQEIHIHYTAQDPIQWHKDLPKSVSQISPTFAIKAKSQASFLSSCTKEGKPSSLMELNQKTFEKVWNEYITEEERMKYQEKGRKLQFGEDIFVPSPPTWVDTPLKITHSDSVTIIQSPYTKTDLDNEQIPEKMRGMFYGKPMTAAQIYEWIVYDAYRKIPSED
ncbi:hypothetical protein CTEN210_01349 [Chaetoceros tenuissimus]|uniref:Uncharacterized protein n=1 Tax=Chaetoceros tenuissimus TaxID=426638 RepID=A0AAD3CGU2_9STRA|nr:hypothetical protein CTEN210_01349 [Chaetoceros tenuissimus]